MYQCCFRGQLKTFRHSLAHRGIFQIVKNLDFSKSLDDFGQNLYQRYVLCPGKQRLFTDIETNQVSLPGWHARSYIVCSLYKWTVKEVNEDEKRFLYSRCTHSMSNTTEWYCSYLSLCNMQDMLLMCENYSSKWWFTFSLQKSEIRNFSIERDAINSCPKLPQLCMLV